ncbi:MAG: phosphoglucomutase [Ignavibacteriaceae bacterium]|nr:phosphoglucomutase [Ignavibacteriaceae bacterium]
MVFGTDGWRGLINEELNNQNIGRVAAAFALYLVKNTRSGKMVKVAIGYDGRQYSRKFAVLFSRVLASQNIEVFFSEQIIPTPLLSYYVRANYLDAGVMVTASHNPPEYNGIKFKASYGGPFLTEETHKVESYIDRELVQVSDKNIHQVDFTNIYFQQIEKMVDFYSIRKSGIKVLIDSMAGAGQQMLENILLKHHCPAETIFKFAESDFASRLPEPIEKNLTPLRDELIANGNYAMGIATDGDADRVGILMDNGEWLSAQETILYLSDFLINYKKLSGDIVKTSSVTDKLVELTNSTGRGLHNVQVGFKYICEKMITEDILFGAEESGGFGYKNHMPERDGLLSGLLMTEMLAVSGYSKLSEYVKVKRKEFGDTFYKRIDMEYHSPDRNDLLPELYGKNPDAINGEKVKSIQSFYSSRNVINGLKFTFRGNARWLLIRSSETEPLLRFYAEGNSNEDVDKLLNIGKDIITIK